MPDHTGFQPSAGAFDLFVAAINSHDAAALFTLMTPDHLFVDSLGNRVQGAASVQAGWRGYFALCPDSSIRIDTSLARSMAGEETILAAGEAAGTIYGVPWHTPAAWLAIVRENLVSEWRVFADNKPVYDILARRSR